MVTGRITASKLKAALCTDTFSSSISLIMKSCYFELCKFKTAVTKWGCDHEQVARDKYTQLSKLFHREFEIQENGLFLNVEYPYVGASPDGLVTCLCCSDGICEIKVNYGYDSDILILYVYLMPSAHTALQIIH